MARKRSIPDGIWARGRSELESLTRSRVTWKPVPVRDQHEPGMGSVPMLRRRNPPGAVQSDIPRLTRAARATLAQDWLVLTCARDRCAGRPFLRPARGAGLRGGNPL